MNMREKILLGAAVAAASAVPAFAQTVPGFSGSVSGTTTSSVTTGASTTSTTGDSTVSPFINTTTTVTQQTLTTSLGATTTGGTVTFNGSTFGYSVTGSGTGSQPQAVSSSLIQTFTPGTPPVVASSTTTTSTANVGTASVTAISVSGAAGAALASGTTGTILYGGNLSSSGAITNNTVAVTENVVGVTTSGVTFATYGGTATFSPSTGVVSVALNSSPTSSTSITSSGLTTTGTVAATNVTATNVTAANVSVTSSLNMNGNRITNVGTPTAATDAATKGYVDTAIAGVNSSLTTLNSLVESNRKRSDAGIATAVALSGGMFLPNKKINLTANVGAFRDEAAVAAQLGVLVSDNLALNAGVATSFHSYGGTAVRGGFTLGF